MNYPRLPIAWPRSAAPVGGDSLPITGAETASLVGAGAVPLIAGAVGFVVAHSYRIRFTA